MKLAAFFKNIYDFWGQIMTATSDISKPNSVYFIKIEENLSPRKAFEKRWVYTK